MKKKNRPKIPKLRSKKGMTLIEILVAVLIIVIVFGSTLSAMTNGFSSTLRNANADQDAVKGESANDVIFQAIYKQRFAKADDAKAVLNPGKGNDNIIEKAAQTVISDMEYVDSENEDFDTYEADNKFTVIFSSSSVDKNNTYGKNKASFSVKGMIIKTSVKTTSGYVINESFVPYADQSD